MHLNSHIFLAVLVVMLSLWFSWIFRYEHAGKMFSSIAGLVRL